MRRGQTLENYISALISQLGRIGIHGHKNNPLRTIAGQTLKGESFDYEIFMPDAVHLFDAKECSNEDLKWRLSPFKNTKSRYCRQLNALYGCTVSPSVQAYFLVYFVKSPQSAHITAFSVQTVMQALKDGRKWLTPEDGQEWTIPGDLQDILNRM